MLAFRELILLSGLNLISGPERDNFQNGSPHTRVEWARPSRVRTCSTQPADLQGPCLPLPTKGASHPSVNTIL